MIDKPILFSTPMVKAILENRKFQTRRVIKNKSGYSDKVWFSGVPHNTNETGYKIAYLKVPYDSEKDIIGDRICSPFEIGDRLWVRETHFIHSINQVGAGIGVVEYKNGTTLHLHYEPDSVLTQWDKWRPSIFMPRWASRITLEVTEIRVQRLQEISHEDITAEGLGDGYTEIGWNYAFGQLWNQINEKRGYGWEVNPWVFAYTFKRVGVK